MHDTYIHIFSFSSNTAFTSYIKILSSVSLYTLHVFHYQYLIFSVSVNTPISLFNIRIFSLIQQMNLYFTNNIRNFQSHESGLCTGLLMQQSPLPAKIFPTTHLGSTACSFSLSPPHCPDLTEILLKRMQNH